MLDFPARTPDRADARARPAPLIAFHDHAAEEESFLDAVLEGLSQRQKSIPCRFLYDERGSALFDAICELDEYYPTRTETRILRARRGGRCRRRGP